MDITKSNFNEMLPFVKETINDCDFIAIDTELTGLYGESTTEHAFDSMEERYVKIKELCSKFLIIQFGVSAFKYHPIEKRYTHKDFNFYIFPNPHTRQAPDQRFLCQTSSLHYLAAQNFDFNKVIYEGIPYLRHDQEEKLKQYTSNKYRVQKNTICTPKKDVSDANGQQREIHIPDEHKEFIDDIHKQVGLFISNESESILKLDPCNALQRKLIYETVKQKYKTGIEMETLVNPNKERYIAITKSSDDDRLKNLGLKELCDMDDIDTAIGFRKVVEHISKSRKLVLGHHMYLDILHTINQFFYPLPESLQEYKEMLHLIFPMLLDTKYLASVERLRQFLEGTTVSDIAKCIQGKAFNLPQIDLEEVGKGYDMSETKYHEAGFDAFVTGVNFIALARKLGSMESKNSEHIDCQSEVLAPHLNKFYVLRHYDIPFLNLSGADLNPDRSNVFHVSFPEEWKTVDLVELFLPYGEIYVHWLDDVSALVALKNPANTINAKSALLNKSSKMYHVRTYVDYQKGLKQQSSNEEVLLKKPIHPISNSPSISKKKSEQHNRLSMESIIEADENEAEEAFPGKPPSKKLKKSYDDPESGEVTSTFEEESTW